MNVTFLISSLKCGGAEKVITTMANYWAEKNHHVNIIKFDSISDVPFYTISDRVTLTSIDIHSISNNIIQSSLKTIKRLIKIRKAIINTRPNVVISFIDITNILTIISMIGLKIPVIISERTNPLKHKIGSKWAKLRNLTYPFCSKLIVQTNDILNIFSNKIKVKSMVIPNPVLAPEYNCDIDIAYNSRQIISVGRLCEAKGFDLLIHAFKNVCQKHKDWTLSIYGEGPLKRDLEKLIFELGLTEKVILAGITKNVCLQMSKSAIFVLSSKYEGYPNALCEAMSCGMPVISTDCPSGPSSIIQNGHNGILVPTENIDSLEAAINELIEDKEKCRIIGQNAREILLSHSIDNIMRKWENVINEVSNEDFFLNQIPQ